jgi:hypothetical protein
MAGVTIDSATADSSTITVTGRAVGPLEVTVEFTDQGGLVQFTSPTPASPDRAGRYTATVPLPDGSSLFAIAALRDPSGKTAKKPVT